MEVRNVCELQWWGHKKDICSRLFPCARDLLFPGQWQNGGQDFHWVESCSMRFATLRFPSTCSPPTMLTCGDAWMCWWRSWTAMVGSEIIWCRPRPKTPSKAITRPQGSQCRGSKRDRDACRLCDDRGHNEEVHTIKHGLKVATRICWLDSLLLAKSSIGSGFGTLILKRRNHVWIKKNNYVLNTRCMSCWSKKSFKMS